MTARKALTALLSLDMSVQNKIVDAIKEVGFPYSRRKTTLKARQLHEELKVLDVDTLFNIMDSITDLVIIPTSELPEALAEMSKDSGIPFSNLEVIVKAITSDPSYIKQRAVQEFTSQALPFVRGFEHFCAIRTRFDKNFNYNEDNIESYDPKAVDHHPVVVLKLTLDDREKAFTFQLDQERLDRLISELIAAQRQLKVVTDNWTQTRNEKTNAE